MEKLRYGKVQRNGVRPVIWTKRQLRFIQQAYEDGQSLRAIAQHFGFETHSRITVVCRENGWTRTKRDSPSATFRRFLLLNPDWCLQVYNRPGYSARMAAEKISKEAKVENTEELANVLNRWLKEIDAKKSNAELNSSLRVVQHGALKSEIKAAKWLAVTKFKNYAKYKAAARRISIILFTRWDKHLPELRHRKYGLVVDHIFSIAEGYKQGVSLNIICHPANMQTVSRRYNLLKGNRCDLTLKQLKAKIRQFNMVYGDPFKIGDRLWLRRK